MDNQGTIPVLLVTGYSPRCEVIRENLAAINNGLIQLEVLQSTSQLDQLHGFKPEVSVLDLANLHQPPVECVQKIKKSYPGSRILALHIYQTHSLIEPLFESGIDGYLTYEPSKNELENALLEVLNGNRFVPDSLH